MLTTKQTLFVFTVGYFPTKTFPKIDQDLKTDNSKQNVHLKLQ